MEALIRKPYQGVINIIRFNWHFYAWVGLIVLLLLFASSYLHDLMFWLSMLLAAGIVASTCVTVFVSHYIYDRSGLYDFTWLGQFDKATVKTIVNIHAGFDETSSILKKNFPEASINVFDFYDASAHTEISIERARKAYPAYPGTLKVTTSQLPLGDECVDIIFNIFALHEVRNRKERIQFLKEQSRLLHEDANVVVVEHLRDLPNFLAYTLGFFHFLSEKEWATTFQQARLRINTKFKITPFITVYILSKA